jgi:6-phosphofructokinase 1
MNTSDNNIALFIFSISFTVLYKSIKKSICISLEKKKIELELLNDIKLNNEKKNSKIVNKEKDNKFEGTILPGAIINEIRIHEIDTLRGLFPSADCDNCNYGEVSYNKVIDKEDYILNSIVRNFKKKEFIDAYIRAGPRAITHFDPKKINAAIVTCGGLCPGLNHVIRELVHALIYLYDVNKIFGIRGGYHGFSDAGDYKHTILTIAKVLECHHQGGTILASSRGGFDLDQIISFLIKHDINQLYIIGGDGTHRGAFSISQEVIKRGLNISVVGIPKTIDNDVDLIDRSFGFTTSVEAAQDAILSAKTEAKCNLPNGIGIVKLMGRSAGFIAAHSTLASGDVDLCLIPEIAIELEGDKGCLPYLMKRIKEQGHAVVVVAEGAGEELLGKSIEIDASGNHKLPSIGDFLKKEITSYFKKEGMEATVKYIDPSYMIRSVPANASDSLLCMLLSQNAVHGAMAGFTGFSVGLVNNRVVFIPIPKLVATSPRLMDPNGRTWERVIAMTRQPINAVSSNALLQALSVNGRTII